MTTEKPTKEQLAKLPVWARAYIARLEADKTEMDTLRAAIGEAVPEGASGLVTWSVLMDDYPLPDRASVCFRFQEEDAAIEVGLSRSNPGEHVLMIRGSGGLIVQPQAGNVIAVRLEKRG